MTTKWKGDGWAKVLKALAWPWWIEIEEAKGGKLAPLIEALRSERPIRKVEERWLRDSLADVLATCRFMQPKGRPKLPQPRPHWMGPQDPALWLAVDYVKRFKRVRALRYHRRWGVEREAISKAAEKFGLDEDRIHNYLHRSKRQQGSKNKRINTRISS